MRILVDTSVWVDFFNGHPSPQAADLFRRLRERGITIRSTIDCLIAILAAHHDALILSKDRDLTLIVESNLLVLRSMPVV